MRPLVDDRRAKAELTGLTEPGQAAGRPLPGQPLPQGLGDDAGHRLAGGARDLLCEAMGLRIFDVKAHPYQGLLPTIDFVYLSTWLFARRLQFQVRFQHFRGERPRTGGRPLASTTDVTPLAIG